MSDKKFLILASDHPNNAVLSVGQWMAGGLKTIGFDAHAISIPRDINKLSEFFREGVSGILSLGPMPLDVKVDQHWYLWQKINCPVWLYMLDAIIYDYHRVPVMKEFMKDALTTERLKIVSPENGYMNLLGKISKGGILPDQSFHIPFGHFANLSEAKIEKENRLCIIGTIGNELGLRSDIDSLDDVFDIYGKYIENKSLKSRVLEIFNSSNVPDMPVKLLMEGMNWTAADIFEKNNLPLICAVDSFYKRLRRFLAVRSLKSCKIDFYGWGWDKYFPEERNFRFVGNIKHQEIAVTCAKYKAVVNFDPNWESGLHDRVYTSCAMGVPVITNKNDAIHDLNLSENLIHTYTANRPDMGIIIEKIFGVDGEKYDDRLKIIRSHSWTDRMARLINAELRD